MRILIADDDPDLAEVVAQLLAAAGFDTTTATTAADILDRARAMRPDVLLQDVRMPGLDLPRHIAAVRAEPGLRSLKVVLCSASMELEELADRVEADGILEKPYDPVRMVSFLRGFAAMRAAPPA